MSSGSGKVLLCVHTCELTCAPTPRLYRLGAGGPETSTHRLRTFRLDRRRWTKWGLDRHTKRKDARWGEGAWGWDLDDGVGGSFLFQQCSEVTVE